MIIFSLGFTFSLASVPGEQTGIDSVSVPGAGAVCSVRSTRRITVSVSDSFRHWIHYYMFPKSYMMVTKAPQDPNWSNTYVFRTYFSLLLVRIERCRSHTSGRSDWNFLNIFTIFRPKCAYFWHIFGVFKTKCVYLRPNEYIDVQWGWFSGGYKGFTDCRNSD